MPVPTVRFNGACVLFGMRRYNNPILLVGRKKTAETNMMSSW